MTTQASSARGSLQALSPSAEAGLSCLSRPAWFYSVTRPRGHREETKEGDEHPGHGRAAGDTALSLLLCWGSRCPAALLLGGERRPRQQTEPPACSALLLVVSGGRNWFKPQSRPQNNETEEPPAPSPNVTDTPHGPRGSDKQTRRKTVPPSLGCGFGWASHTAARCLSEKRGPTERCLAGELYLATPPRPTISSCSLHISQTKDSAHRGMSACVWGRGGLVVMGGGRDEDTFVIP